MKLKGTDAIDKPSSFQTQTFSMLVQCTHPVTHTCMRTHTHTHAHQQLNSCTEERSLPSLELKQLVSSSALLPVPVEGQPTMKTGTQHKLRLAVYDPTHRRPSVNEEPQIIKHVLKYQAYAYCTGCHLPPDCCQMGYVCHNTLCKQTNLIS